MNKSTAKMILRSIKSSAGRFAAIFAISALGVGFLAGLSAATPDMAMSGSKYFSDNRLADARVASNIGLDPADAEALAKIEGVDSVMAVKTLDAIFNTDAGTAINVTVIGLRELDQPVNKLTLVSGRMPANSSECLVESTVDAVSHAEAGDALTLSEQNEDDALEALKVPGFTVVGVVENPYYMAMSREQTSIGNGKINEIIYAPEECFDTDYYTSIYMTFKGTAGKISLSDEYNAVAGPIIDDIEALAETRKYARHDRVLAEAREKIDDAWDEYNEKKAEADEEFAKAEDKIRQAEIDIAEGKKTLADKTREAEQEIADGQKELDDALIELQDGQKEYEDGLVEYQDGLKEYEDGVKEYQDGRAEYLEAKEKYDDGLKEYEDGLKEYEDGEKELEQARRRLNTAENKLSEGYAQLKAGKAALAEAQAQLDAPIAAAAQGLGLEGITTARALIDAADSDPAIAAVLSAMGIDIETLRDAQGQLDEQSAVIEASQKQLDAGSNSLSAGQDKYKEGVRELKEAKRQLLNSHLQLEEARRQLEDADKDLWDAEMTLMENERKLKDAKEELDQAEIDLKDGWAEYYDGVEELEDGKRRFEEETAKARRDIAKGERDLAEGRHDYEEAKAEADEKLADAEYEIKDAELKLNDIESPKWYILGRDSMITPAGFDSNTEKVASIAKVFPVFFFLIAALVCLTTMTRMVEEERGVIGTMKALGYSSGAVMTKYLLYALLASCTGSAVGLAVGFKLFPSVIWNAYGIMYRLPELHTPFNLKYAAFSALSTIACILAATWWVCRESLKESAASLMLPKAPQPGKRVFLEYITPLWRRMSFNGKVTVRNLFRYKKRFFMTVVGVAGCTALLVTGFGLKDSIDNILHNQFDILWKFDLMIGVREGDGEEDYRLYDIVSSLDGYMPARQESGTVSLRGGPESDVTVYCPQDASAFASDYVIFRRRTDHEPVNFGPGLAVLTEKAADTIGASIGDEITLVNPDGDEARVKLAGITENYIQGFLYVAPDVYESLFGAAPEYNTLLCRSGGLEENERDALAERILKCSSAQSATFTEDTAENFSDTFKSIDMIVWVLIICAGLLAFVVLYNLTNININERHKEIATLKVLGFYEREVSSYILKETNALSLIGAVIGLGAGKILHLFVAKTAEVDMVMFGRIISPFSYVISIAMTMAFSLLVSLFMAGKLRRVSMVESLKAPE